jgi:hypothetical protein
MKTQKDLNAEVARRVAGNPFWNGDIFTKYFADDFTMDIPSAPPGMPNHYDTWEAERCFEWLNRSVRRWESRIISFYPTPDPELFWAEGEQKGDVFWGEHDGSLATKFFMKIQFRNGKVSYLSWRFHTWAWLLAAGKRVHSHVTELPADKDGNIDEFDKDFVIDFNDPDILNYLKAPTYGCEAKGTEKQLDLSKEAISQRRQINIYQFACGYDREAFRRAEVLSPDYKKVANFTGSPYVADGPDLDDPRAFAWNKVCSPWMYRDPRNKFYPTDDPNTIFVEMNAHGPGCWRTRSCKIGHYKQNYLVRLILDDEGRLVRFEEIANPVNGLNSTATEIPSFPYYH